MPTSIPNTVGDLDGPGMFGTPSARDLLRRRIIHMNILFAPTARQIALWHNLMQDEARKHPVEASRPDVPFDTASPTFRFGHGLRYTR